jgi:glucan biosynthesis protein C
VTSPSPRLAWVDNLRTLVIVLVVNMHACVTYSHVGDWYLKEGSEPPMPMKLAFLFWQGHLQSFFMGLLFFVSGVFAQRSLERRGPRSFLRERAFRLGLPSLLYMLVIHPFMVFVMLGHPRTPDRPGLARLYLDYLASGRVLSGNGPLWFALALLGFCVALVAARLIRPGAASGEPETRSPPGSMALFRFACVLVIATFAVRLVQPIGTNVFNFQLCFFPQYIASFAAGVVAGRFGWLESLATARPARIAGWLALFGGPVLLLAILILGGPVPEGGPTRYAGGWNGQAFGLALWEQATGLGLGLGLLALFRTRVNLEGPITRWLSARAFGVYVLHPPVLVALTQFMRRWNVDAFSHMALLTALGLAATFALADAAKRIPGLRAVL